LVVMRLFSNAVVRTFAPTVESDTPEFCDPATPPPDAILVDGETIVAVGTTAELLDIASAESSTTAALASGGVVGASAVVRGLEIEEIDCYGQIILPGFVDGLMYSIASAYSIEQLYLSQTRSLAEAVDAICELALTMPVGELVGGSGWDLNKW